ncbi:MAG TPA: molybdopterin converting factor subunit 1 [Ktedonobacteraceae bacterium]|jgi:molybdopterin converting factor subunit 1
MTSIQIRMRYFALLREVMGKQEELLSVPQGTSVTRARAVLLDHYPELENALARAVCAVNRQYVSPATVLQEGDELVFIPPVGGGRL